MTPKELYPIGTQFITWRLSQAALAHELGFLIETKSTFDNVWVKGFYRIILNPHINPNEQDGDIVCKEAEEWRVIVTEENQERLSPVPMVEDLVIFHGESHRVPYPQFWKKHNIYDGTQTVEKRTYTNGQRAPLIEFDEVVLPKEKNDD